MKRSALFSFLFAMNSSLLASDAAQQPILAAYQADWLVVGAGPAGISAVAALLDASVKPENIIWVDEAFSVGTLGQHYADILPNSSPANFLQFVKLSGSLQRHILLFRRLSMPSSVPLRLKDVITPLQTITAHFRQVVANVRGRIDHLSYDSNTNLWTATMPAIRLDARNVILAIGSQPKKSSLATQAQHIPLEIALDEQLLKKHLVGHKSVAVFGSSHSAALGKF